MKRLIGLMLVGGALLVTIGCRSTSERRFLCCNKDQRVVKPVYAPIPQPAPAFPIQQSGATLPPGAVLTPPPGANVVVPPGTPPPSISKSPPAVWQPGDPIPEPKRDLPPSIKLYAPEPIDKEAPKPEVKIAFPPIPQFAQAFDKVYAGLKPPAEGLDWLQDRGVKTVVQVRLFGEDDSADKKLVEQRNMRYVPFEVSPVVLSKEKTDEFIKLIRDGAKQGIYVYDEDGSLAGAMWYLHMRYGEFLEDDASRLRAEQLGLRPMGFGQHRDMWLAAKKLAGENSK